MSQTFTETVTLEKIDCGRCGGTYAINERLVRDRSDYGGSWHCPYCQCSWGYHEGALTKVQRELEAAKAETRAAKCETLREQLTRQETEKKLRRVKNGVCPCCKRSFCNLMRHMKTKHPEFKQ